MRAEQAKNFLSSRPPESRKIPFWQVGQTLFLLLMWALFKWSKHYKVISSIDDVETLAKLQSQADNDKCTRQPRLVLSRTERQTEKAYTWYNTIANLPNATKNSEITEW